MRLDRYLSYALNISRRDSRLLIRSGRITVNNHTIMKKDFYIDEYHDEIVYDNKKLEYTKYIYLMLNKPKGYVSATRDLHLPTVVDCIKGYEKYNLFMAGRLDIDTEGFVLLTNDGKYAYNIMRPQSKLGKKYFLEINDAFKPEDVILCQKGMYIYNSRGLRIKTQPALLEVISIDKAYLTIYEGKYHQIKQMCYVLGKELKYLKRISIGLVDLDPSLKPGQFRPL